MKITKLKLKQIIKEEYAHTIREDDLELRSDGAEVVVDMTGREYPVEALENALDDEALDVLMRNPGSYFVRIKNGEIVGVGPE